MTIVRTKMELMELKHLRTFVITTEQGSFTRAAAELGLTQAAVSQHIAALERAVECKLFDRSGRKVELTPAGRKLCEYAVRLLSLAEEARQTVLNQAAEVQGTIRIATSSVPAEAFVPNLLARFRRQYPAVRERLVVSDTGLSCTAVLNGEADVGFVGNLPKSDQLNAQPVGHDELRVIMLPDHPLAAKRSLTLNQLATEPLLVREPESGSRQCVERTLAAHDMRLSDFNVVMEVNSNEAIRAAIGQGVGLAFLSSDSVKLDVESGRFASLSIRGVRFTRQLYLITRQDRVPSSPLRELLAMIDGK